MTLIPGVSSAVAAERWRGARFGRRRGLMLALLVEGVNAVQGVTRSRAEDNFMSLFSWMAGCNLVLFFYSIIFYYILLDWIGFEGMQKKLLY